MVVVSLDPANYSLPYPAAIDIKELIDMEEVMETFQLGPNGGQQGRVGQQPFAARNATLAGQRCGAHCREPPAADSAASLLPCSIVSAGLIYCMEYLEKNLTWLKQRIKEQQKLVPSQ